MVGISCREFRFAELHDELVYQPRQSHQSAHTRPWQLDCAPELASLEPDNKRERRMPPEIISSQHLVEQYNQPYSLLCGLLLSTPLIWTVWTHSECTLSPISNHSPELLSNSQHLHWRFFRINSDESLGLTVPVYKMTSYIQNSPCRTGEPFHTARELPWFKNELLNFSGTFLQSKRREFHSVTIFMAFELSVCWRAKHFQIFVLQKGSCYCRGMRSLY